MRNPEILLSQLPSYEGLQRNWPDSGRSSRFKLFICGPELDLIREMINSDLKNTGSENRGTDMHTFDKQTPSTTKKAVLADVPVANRNLMLSHQEGLQFMERRPIADTIRFCGRKKRFRPQNPVIPPVNPILSNTAAKEHLTYARNKFELETGRNRIQNSTVNYSGGSKLRPFRNMQQEIPQKPTQIRSNDLHYVPSITPNHLAPKMTLSCVPPLLPSSFGKPNNGVGAAECDSLKDSSDTQHFAKSKRANDQQWEERYIRLQNSLKRCDESDNRDLLQKIRQLSPADLSMYVFELEKKAIQLAVDEEKEMQRMKALNILGISSTTMDPLQTAGLPRPMK